VLLILLGVTKGVSALVPDDNFRLISVGLGCFFVAVAVVVGLLGPGRHHVIDEPSPSKIPELKTQYAELSPKQREILHGIEEKTSGRSLVSEHELQSVISLHSSPTSELFYRLEQLRLLGFVERELLNPSRGESGYRFTEEYAGHIGRTSSISASYIPPTPGPPKGRTSGPA
jgi:hypothetical protein